MYVYLSLQSVMIFKHITSLFNLWFITLEKLAAGCGANLISVRAMYIYTSRTLIAN